MALPLVQVIYLVNSADEGLVNGSRGVVTEFDDVGCPRVRFADGITRTILSHTWEHRPDPRVATVAATLRQLPLKLAWALSVHKAQVGAAFFHVCPLMSCPACAGLLPTH